MIFAPSGPTGVLLEPPGAVLGVSWAHRWSLLGHIGATLRASWAVLDALKRKRRDEPGAAQIRGKCPKQVVKQRSALLGIAWHCLALLGIAWHCWALPGIAWHPGNGATVQPGHPGNPCNPGNRATLGNPGKCRAYGQRGTRGVPAGRRVLTTTAHPLVLPQEK